MKRYFDFWHKKPPPFNSLQPLLFVVFMFVVSVALISLVLAIFLTTFVVLIFSITFLIVVLIAATVTHCVSLKLK